ncbi:helix-turn-helix domain-containing protein [Nocardia callitridis]|uniref:HTH cro/C1-type domain-containing protein n=1 Tax=Nocardia callitridis TaxID=648753 RepID=A0ABP9KN08_9NOCA
MTNPTTEPNGQAVDIADELAREIRRLRLAAGLSQRRLAAKIGYSRQYVSMTEWQDAALPSQEVTAALDTALHAQGALLAIRARAKGIRQAKHEPPREQGSSFVPPVAEHAHFVTEPTESRENGNAPEGLADVLGRIHKWSRSVHPGVVEHLRVNTLRTIEQYETLDSASLVDGLVRQRMWIDDLLQESAPERQRRQLFDVAAQTSGLLGFITVGIGDFPLGRAYCAESFQLSGVIDDANLQAWARGLQSFCEYYSGRYDEALNYALDGLSYAGDGSQRVRLLVNGVARAYGKLGDSNGVRLAVDDAYEALSKGAVPQGVPSSISLDCYSVAQVAGNAATAYVSLSMPDKAEEYARSALLEMNSSNSPWGRSLVTVDLARSHIQSKQPDVEYASSLMIDALGSSSGKAMIPLRHRAAEFVQDATDRWGKLPRLREVREALDCLE